MFEIFVSLGLGILITHFYHILSDRNQKLLYKKLSSELRDIILSDKRKSITVSRLNELLRNKTLDAKYDKELPYKACPKCGSENLVRSKDFIVDEEAGDDGLPFQTTTPYKTIECDDCGWRDDEIEKHYKLIEQ